MSSVNRRRITSHRSLTTIPKVRLSLLTLESRVTPVRFMGQKMDFAARGFALDAPAAVAPAIMNGPAWTELAAVSPAPAGKTSYLALTTFIPLSLNSATLESVLRTAPAEYPGWNDTSPTILELPKPDGTTARFRIVDAPIMEPGLAAQFPMIRTYRGQGIDDPAATLAADFTAQGFHAQVLAPEGAWYIDPYYHLDTSMYASYALKDMTPREPNPCMLCQGAGCGVCQSATVAAIVADAVTSRSEPDGDIVVHRSGTQLRTYRTAVAATGEYTVFHGGTVALGMSAITTAMNRVSGVYELELSIRLSLIANNNLIVYTNGGTDPYSNNDGGAMLSQNQSNLDSVIGNANYDLGHVFSTGGGGIAGLGVVGITGSKARGVTGSPAPIGDAFTIDYVAHEMGHQFGAAHTFNGTQGSAAGNRSASSAYEPGSGSTIMAYAGICLGDDLQPHSDAYFHSRSFDQIIAFVDGSIPGVGTRTNTGNLVPTVEAGPNYSIPTGTPFALTAAGSDGNGDTLTYNWEQRSLGAAQSLAQMVASDNGASPIFRSWNSTVSGTRTFPRLTNVLSNTLPIGERYPGAARASMPFRVTVRDNRAGGGGVNTDDMIVTVVNTGAAFQITTQNSVGTSYPAGSTQDVFWNVAGTTANGINAALVNIRLSTDGGLTFPTILAAGTANDGSESITIPNSVTTTARIKVEPTNNIFFDINNANFSITATAPTITGFQVNDGVSAQRSRVTSLTVTFSTVVNFSGAIANAFTLGRTGGGAVGGFTATASNATGVTVVTLNGFTGAETNFTSLADGRFVLTVIAGQVSNAGGTLAGDNQFDDSDGLFRLFGDISGNRSVDIQDYGQFSLSYPRNLGDPGFNAAFDFNGDTHVDIFDYGQFGLRYLQPLP